MNQTLISLNRIVVLAQEAGDAAQEPGFLEIFGFPLMMMITLYILFVIMPQSKDRKGRADFMSQLKKNDNVVTYGGIFGTIVGFSADGDQVTLRVDDNTRIRVRKSSIESIVKSESAEKKADEKTQK
ncbi:preprotein translocase subunit YajC [bacterium]|nr:preprotein translocase subunit YajC [bacterium]